MKILADENIEREFIEALRVANFDVLSIRENYIGAADDKILQIAVSERAVIVTYDTDFGELVFRFGLQSHGVILLRVHGLSLAEKAQITILAIREHEAEIEVYTNPGPYGDEKPGDLNRIVYTASDETFKNHSENKK